MSEGKLLCIRQLDASEPLTVSLFPPPKQKKSMILCTMHWEGQSASLNLLLPARASCWCLRDRCSRQPCSSTGSAPAAFPPLACTGRYIFTCVLTSKFLIKTQPWVGPLGQSNLINSSSAILSSRSVCIDLTLLVRGMQGAIERVGLNNSGPLLQAEVWLVVGLIGRGSGWFWGESQVGTWARLKARVGLISGGRGYG